MVVDCHVHLNHYGDDPVPSLASRVDLLTRLIRRNRLDFALILTSYEVTAQRPSTREVVEAIRDLPYLAVVAGLNYGTFGPDDLAELEDYVKDGVVRGLKLYPGYQPFYPSDPRWKPAYEFAAEHHIPVMIHTGDTYTPKGKLKFAHPLHVDDVAVDFRDVRFVICHLGNPWIRDCMEVVYKNANVSADISGLMLGTFEDRFELYMRRQFQDMLTYGVEPRAVLYGTDWPICSMESYLEFMADLPLPEADRRRIMGENAVELFRLDRRASRLRGAPRPG